MEKVENENIENETGNEHEVAEQNANEENVVSNSDGVGTKTLEDMTFAEMLEAYYFLCNGETSPSWKTVVDASETNNKSYGNYIYWIIAVCVIAVVIVCIVLYVKFFGGTVYMRSKSTADLLPHNEKNVTKTGWGAWS